MSANAAHPLKGATPPEVFSRWIKVVRGQPFAAGGPGLISNHLEQEPGNAPGATNWEAEDEAIDAAQTVLVSFECCQGARAVPLSNGLGLRKWVMI